MPIKVTCQQCQKTLKAPEKLAGKRVRCPACQEVVQVPAMARPELDDDFFADPEPQSTRKARPEADPEFDWSEPLDNRDVSKSEGEFDNVDNLPTLPVAPRKKPKKRSDPDLAFVSSAGVEESSRSSSGRKRTSRALPLSTSGGLGYWHWILLVGMLPLAISIFIPMPPFIDRLQPLVEKDPTILDRLVALESRDQFNEFVASLPDGRIPGAHLARKTFVHWVYALLSAGAFLGLILVMFPGANVAPGKLLLYGVITGTVGIVLLLGFQYVAEFTQGIHLRRVRGIVGLLFYLVKFIGFSYRCATDGETGFALSFLGFTCGVGLCEELCKALPVAFYLAANRDVNWRTACVLGLASGIGFGVSEGIMYSADYYNGFSGGLTYLVRFASCVTLHAVWASSVALLMYNNQDYLPGHADAGWDALLSFVVFYLGIAMILHGLYDTLLKQHLEIAAMGIAAGSFGWWAWQLYQQD
ncbi:MAG: PrsW family glutamic-type intramembrane protease [Planctomycetota bacterium]